jgi:LacI family transcriptional regulator
MLVTKKVTVYDIATEMGISVSTVSRVLNNSRLISDERSREIQTVAKRLGYTKRTIRKQGNRAILNIKLFLPAHKHVYTHLFYNPAELIDGLYEGFSDVKVNIITNLINRSDRIFQNKKVGDIDGCVFAFCDPDDETYGMIEKRGIPLLVLNRIDEKRNFISCDNRLGMETLLQKIVETRKGPLRVFYIGYTQVPVINSMRKEGIFLAAKKAGIPFSSKDVREFGSIQAITGEFLRSLKNRKYNVLMCYNDLVASYVYNLAMAERLSFPRDFSLTGFDNSPILNIIPQRIATINLSVGQLGVEAGKWLRKRIIDRDPDGVQEFLEGEFVPGTTI